MRARARVIDIYICIIGRIASLVVFQLRHMAKPLGDDGCLSSVVVIPCNVINCMLCSFRFSSCECIVLFLNECTMSRVDLLENRFFFSVVRMCKCASSSALDIASNHS